MKFSRKTNITHYFIKKIKLQNLTNLKNITANIINNNKNSDVWKTKPTQLKIQLTHQVKLKNKVENHEINTKSTLLYSKK